jgi:transposase InsO family protein
MIFRVIRDHLVPEFTVRDCCRVLKVSISGYYRWLKHPVGKREASEIELAGKIREVHAQTRGVYGSPRIRTELMHRGVKRNRKTIARIMHKHAIRSKVKRKFRVRTTDSNHDHPIAPNLLDRNFTVEALDQVWLCDITYIPTGEGWLYLAGVMDLCSRRIVGWSMADHMRAGLVVDALEMARTRRNPAPGLLHHSDRGVQYACKEYRELLDHLGAVASMSRAGECRDNAPAESFWSTLKNELVHHEEFATRAEARAAIFDYIEVFYNRTRLHSSLGYISPEAFEASRR